MNVKDNKRPRQGPGPPTLPNEAPVKKPCFGEITRFISQNGIKAYVDIINPVPQDSVDKLGKEISANQDMIRQEVKLREFMVDELEKKYTYFFKDVMIRLNNIENVQSHPQIPPKDQNIEQRLNHLEDIEESRKIQLQQQRDTESRSRIYLEDRMRHLEQENFNILKNEEALQLCITNLERNILSLEEQNKLMKTELEEHKGTNHFSRGDLIASFEDILNQLRDEFVVGPKSFFDQLEEDVRTLRDMFYSTLNEDTGMAIEFDIQHLLPEIFRRFKQIEDKIDCPIARKETNQDELTNILRNCCQVLSEFEQAKILLHEEHLSIEALATSFREDALRVVEERRITGENIENSLKDMENELNNLKTQLDNQNRDHTAVRDSFKLDTLAKGLEELRTHMSTKLAEVERKFNAQAKEAADKRQGGLNQASPLRNSEFIPSNFAEEIRASIQQLDERLLSEVAILRIELEDFKSSQSSEISSHGRQFVEIGRRLVQVEKNFKEKHNPAKLRKLLAVKGLTTKTMKGDGNCLFRAVADQLFGDEEKHLQIRKEACEYLRKNPKPLLDTSEDVEAYLRRMEKNGEWGGEYEIAAISSAFKVNIFIHQSISKNPYKVLWNGEGNNILTSRRIHLAYMSGNHYDSVRPAKEELFSTEKNFPYNLSDQEEATNSFGEPDQPKTQNQKVPELISKQRIDEWKRENDERCKPERIPELILELQSATKGIKPEPKAAQLTRNELFEEFIGFPLDISRWNPYHFRFIVAIGDKLKEFLEERAVLYKVFDTEEDKEKFYSIKQGPVRDNFLASIPIELRERWMVDHPSNAKVPNILKERLGCDKTEKNASESRLPNNSRPIIEEKTSSDASRSKSFAPGQKRRLPREIRNHPTKATFTFLRGTQGYNAPQHILKRFKIEYVPKSESNSTSFATSNVEASKKEGRKPDINRNFGQKQTFLHQHGLYVKKPRNEMEIEEDIKRSGHGARNKPPKN